MKQLFVVIVSTLLFVSTNLRAAAVPDTVKIGAYVISIHDINFHDKEYIMRFWMWMKTKNTSLDLVNTVEIPNAKDIEKPDLFSDSTENFQWRLMKMKAVMKHAWRVSNYPFDRQELIVSVENSKYNSQQLHFEVDSSGKHYDPDLTVDGWHIADFKIFTNEKKYFTDFGDTSIGKAESVYDSFNIRILLERNAWGLFFKLFIGMYIAFCIASVSFLISPEHIEPRFGLPVGGLFAAVGNKYIIDSILPESNSFTLVDTLHAITFIYIFLIIIESSLSLIVEKKGWGKTAKMLNYYGPKTVMYTYLLLNLVFIVLSILGV
jgi:hypothetical protein